MQAFTRDAESIEMVAKEDEGSEQPDVMSPAEGAQSTHTTSRPGLEAGEPSDYRPDIDGLRAAAVVAVIMYHMEHTWLPGGFVGVDAFFVISGFVVQGSLLRKQYPSSPAFLAAFYSRRVKRLMPGLACMVALMSLATSLIVPPEAVGREDQHASHAHTRAMPKMPFASACTH